MSERCVVTAGMFHPGSSSCQSLASWPVAADCSPIADVPDSAVAACMLVVADAALARGRRFQVFTAKA
eukprot:2302037-Prorocentrum_lima.AAC.1